MLGDGGARPAAADLGSSPVGAASGRGWAGERNGRGVRSRTVNPTISICEKEKEMQHNKQLGKRPCVATGNKNIYTEDIRLTWK
jgi:hypothetical protein